MVGTVTSRSKALSEISQNVITLSECFVPQKSFIQSTSSSSDTISVMEADYDVSVAVQSESNSVLEQISEAMFSSSNSTMQTALARQEQESGLGLVHTEQETLSSPILQDTIMSKLVMSSDSPQTGIAEQPLFCMPASFIEVVPSLSFAPVEGPAMMSGKQTHSKAIDDIMRKTPLTTDNCNDNLLSTVSDMLYNLPGEESDRMSGSCISRNTGPAVVDISSSSIVLKDDQSIVLESISDHQDIGIKFELAPLQGSQAETCSQHESACQHSIVHSKEHGMDRSCTLYSKLCDYAYAMQISSDELLTTFVGYSIQDILRMLNEMAELSRAQWIASTDFAPSDDGLNIRVMRSPAPIDVIVPLRVSKDRLASSDLENCDHEIKNWVRSLRARSCCAVKSKSWNAALLPCTSTKTVPSRSILRKPNPNESPITAPVMQDETIDASFSRSTSLAGNVDMIHSFPQFVPDILVNRHQQIVSGGVSCTGKSELGMSNIQSSAQVLPYISNPHLIPRSSYERLSEMQNIEFEDMSPSPLSAWVEPRASRSDQSNAHDLKKRTSFERLQATHELPIKENSPRISPLSRNAHRTTSFDSFESQLFAGKPGTNASSAAKNIPCNSRSPSLDATAAIDVATSESLLARELRDEISLVLKDLALSDELLPPIKDIPFTKEGEDLPSYSDIDDKRIGQSLGNDTSTYRSDTNVALNTTNAAAETMKAELDSPDSAMRSPDILYAPALPHGAHCEDEYNQIFEAHPDGDQTLFHTLKVASGSIFVGKSQVTASESVSPVAGSRRRQKLSSPFSSPISKLKNLERRRMEKNALCSPSKHSISSETPKWFASLRSPTKKERLSVVSVPPLSPFHLDNLQSKSPVPTSPRLASISWLRSWTVRGKGSKARQLANQRTEPLEELSGMCFEDGPFVDVERDESFNRRWFDRFSHNRNKL